jgi:predicted protein tyrosine phosphatase
MPIRQVSYTSRQHAESLAGNPGTAVISITDPGQTEAQLSSQFKDVLRVAFYDAEPADEYLPAPIPGMFDQMMARAIGSFAEKLQNAPGDTAIIVHCEHGISRSAAVALFIEALSTAPLRAREFAYDANPWVIDRLLRVYPELQIDPPPKDLAHDRRTTQRTD